MITKFKIYEGAFYSVDLINVIYTFFYNTFGDLVTLDSNCIIFNFFKFNPNVLIFNDIIYASKNRDIISIVFHKFNDEYDYLDIIKNYICNNLSSSKINYRYKENYKNNKKKFIIYVNLSYYNELINFFNNLSTHDETLTDIKIGIQSKKYNL